MYWVLSRAGKDAAPGNLGPHKLDPYFLFSSVYVRETGPRKRRFADEFSAAAIAAAHWMFDDRKAAVDVACRYLKLDERIAERPEKIMSRLNRCRAICPSRGNPSRRS